METIITLLIVLIPLIFKAIGKHIEKAGTARPQSSSDSEERIEDWAEVLRRHIEAQNANVEEQILKTEPEVEIPVKVSPEKPNSGSVSRQRPRPRPVVEEEIKQKREKIDPKKLILYSEIMKPKF